MKKIQVIFAIAAFLFASAGVFAGVFTITETYWKHDVNGNACSQIQLLSAPACDFSTPLSCFVDEEVEGDIVRYYFSRQQEDDSTTPPTITCDQYMKRLN